MNMFVNSIGEQEARTENNMKARQSTADNCTDLFFKIGASRGKDIIPQFTAAFVEHEGLALRILQWARDIRQGAGERELFRQVLLNLEQTRPDALMRILPKIPELGRWDDLLVFRTHPFVMKAVEAMIFSALNDGNELCAKWMPRKGPQAIRLRNAFGWSPKFYRKTLVELTNVVEQQMCANDWNNIDYNKVPSLAASRYKKAFNRHSVNFEEYVEKLANGEAKVNAGAIYPYDVIKGLTSYYYKTPYTNNELQHIIAQWDALPNYMGDSKILPMIDVSASMETRVGGTTTAMEVAISLGLYAADKNSGIFKDLFLTFSRDSVLQVAKGNIIDKVKQLRTANWGMSTDIIKAFHVVLSYALQNNVPQADMPEMVVIFSDMQFDSCARFDDSAMESIRRQYELAGYHAPSIVFWNLNAHENVPVRFNEQGVALVSGFSPSIMKAVLSADFEEFTPRGIMLKAVMVDRYAL